MSSTDQPHDTHLYDPARHDNQIVAVFEDQGAAERAQDALRQAGVPADAMHVIHHGGAPAAEKKGTIGDQVLSAFMGLFSSEHDLDYAHAIGQGHAMLVVMPREGVDRPLVIETLERSGALDFDAKLEEWRQAGYSNAGAPATSDRRPGHHEPSASTARVRSYLAERP